MNTASMYYDVNFDDYQKKKKGILLQVIKSLDKIYILSTDVD